MPEAHKVHINRVNADLISAVDDTMQSAIEANEELRAVTASQIAGDAPGSIPNSVLRKIQAQIDPKLPWDTLLNNYMDSFKKDESSFKRPNRRFFPDFILPSAHEESMERISVGIDVSGSITDEMLSSFLSEVEYLKQRMRPDITDIYGFSTHITKHFELGVTDSALECEFKGGGGTNIKPLLDKMQTTQPNVAIIFTDMWFAPYKYDTLTFPVFWVIIDNPEHTPTYGEYAHYSM